jgi:hypothetical protein
MALSPDGSPPLHVADVLNEVVLRGKARQDIVFPPEDRIEFCDRLAEGVRR